MNLNMYLNDCLIDSIEINEGLFSKVRILQTMLEEKHSEIIEGSNTEPVYFIDGMPSRGNMIKEKKSIIYN